MSRNLKEYVYQEILSEIFRGSYSPGDILNEKALIEKYQCSKSPVREALLSLCSENILKNIPRYGYEVVRLTKEDIYEMLAFRFVLESGVLRECGGRISGQDIAELEELDKKCAINDTDVQTHWKYNTEFHLRLIACADNSYITEQLERCMMRLKRAYSQSYWLQKNVEQLSLDTAHHCDILSALKRGDAEAAVKALQADLQDFGEYSAYFNLMHRA